MEQVKAQKELIKQVEQKINIIKAKIDKTVLYAPISGVITRQEGKVGETVNAFEKIVTIDTLNKIKIEADIPEIDIAKIKVDDSTLVTLDALGQDKVFEAKVTKIETREKIIEGIPTYKVEFSFTRDIKGENIKPGMTANIEVITNKKSSALILPQRALMFKNSKVFVKILNENNEISEKEVITGIKSENGMVEILKGLREGQKVIIGTQ